MKPMGLASTAMRQRFRSALNADLCAVVVIVCGLALPGNAHAQAYPLHPVRLVVASSPGSGVDIVARIVAQRMSETLGAQMIVDNRPGAGGTLGVQNVAKSAPDGYTLLMAAPSFTWQASRARSRDMGQGGQGRRITVSAVNIIAL